MKTAGGIRTTTPEQEETKKVSAKNVLTGGPFDFFRKYQRVILYTAGIFALLSFSITGALLGFFNAVFQHGDKGPLMTASDGRDVRVTTEDYDVARALRRDSAPNALPAIVLPPLEGSEESREHGYDQIAALRRLAIESGIEVSSDEVDKAIAQAMRITKIESPNQLALRFGYSSIEEYRGIVAEALRISTFVRVQALAADITDAAIAKEMLGKQKLLTLTIAELDKKAIEEQFKKEPLTDDDLQKWLAGLSETERLPFQDQNHVALRAAGLLFDAFDPEQWKDELKDAKVADEQIQQRYNTDREVLYRREPIKTGGQSGGAEAKDDKHTNPKKDGPEKEPKVELPKKEDKSADDKSKDESKDKKDKGSDKAKAGDTGDHGDKKGSEDGNVRKPDKGPNAGDLELATLRGEGRDAAQKDTAQQDAAQQGDASASSPKSQPSSNPSSQASQPTSAPAAAAGQEPYIPLEQVKDQIKQKLLTEEAFKAIWTKVQARMADSLHAEVDKRIQADKELVAAKTALEEAQAKNDKDKTEDAKKALEAQKLVVAAKEKARADAEDAVKHKREQFDMPAAVRELVKDRKGLVFAAIEEPKGPEGLKDLGALGKWDSPWSAASIDTEGDLGTREEHTDKAAFYFQVTKVVPHPLRPFSEIKEQLRNAYLTKKTDDLAKTKTDALKDKLMALARDQRKDDFQKLEQEKKKEVDTRRDTWKKETEKSRELAHDVVVRLKDPRSPAYQRAVKAEQELDSKLKDVAEQEKKIQAEVDKIYEDKFKQEARKAYAQVLAQAAETAGFKVREVGPLGTDIKSQPRFDQRYSADVKFLFRNASVTALKEGEATDVLEDAAGRAVYVAVAKQVKDAGMEAISRRELMQEREQLEKTRLQQAVAQSFSLEALKQRDAWRLPDAPENKAAGAGNASPKEGPASKASTQR